MPAAADRIRILSGSITEVPLDREYDVIVSCLSFTNSQPEQVR
ncbi:hypothetical protein [Streptomyces sp. NPDC007172]